MSDALAKLRDRRVNAAKALMSTQRSCEGCDLCCTAVGVTALAKPPAVRCQHLTGAAGTSCGIYGDHPKDCREFYCAWRVSDTFLPRDYRPADAGFVVAINDPSSVPIIITVHPDPDRPDAWDTADHRRKFLEIADERNCLVVVGQGRTATHIFAPQGYVFTKADAPELFIDGGLKVGAPEFVFRPFEREPSLRSQTSRNLTGSRWQWK